MFRANLLTPLVKKSSADTNKETPDNNPEGGKDADHKGTRWAKLAGRFGKSEVKKATQDFKISPNSKAIIGFLKKYSKYVKERNEAAHESEFQMVELLMSPSYHQTNDYYFGGGLMEYVYGKAVESMVEEAESDEEVDEIEIVRPE
ncbi:hypothetical protein MMC22_006364 [Lobaria immixta]|nr:hypothetical protein [Lobaria immixta]